MRQKINIRQKFRHKTQKARLSHFVHRQIFIPQKNNIINNSLETRFILQRPLGAGGMCQVFSALDLRRTDWNDACPYVALKMLLPDFRGNKHANLSLAQEFIKARSLSHPGVIKVYDLHMHQGHLCLSMEQINGATVKEILAAGKMPDKNGRYIMAGQICEILNHIHSKGIVHADLKPGNIFYYNNQIVIFDFNISQVIPQLGQPATAPVQALVCSLNIPGYTAAYASPERLAGGGPSQADDVFAAACTIYEILSGTHPHRSLSALQWIKRRQAVKRIDGLTSKQWSCLRAALSFQGSERPAAFDLLKVFKNYSLLNIIKERLL